MKVGINGFGRIGRNVFRAALQEAGKGIDIVAVNDLTDAKTLAHLLKYDSIFGTLDAEIEFGADFLTINGNKMQVLAEKDPGKLPWKEIGVEVVVEATGRFRDKESAGKHLQAGAKKVIITAPAKGEDITIVMGINEGNYDPAKHHIISNASCTTNCLVPVVKVLLDNFGLKRGLMTTIHSYTNDQQLLDFPHSDLRRTRAACLSMIPTTTGAAVAVAKVLPEMKGKMDGLSIRVPTANVSLVDLVAELEKKTTVEEINSAFKKASEGEMSHILEYCDAPLVSRDFNGNSKSAIFDAGTTKVTEDGTFAKVLAWYDNEWAYSCRVVDLIDYMQKQE
jgi:glyceraldehyde 3-phosphate dehydrogenase